MKFGWSLDRPDPVHIKTPDDIQWLRNKLKDRDLLAIDTETTGLDIARDIVVFWSLSTGDDRYFLERDMLEHFQDILADPSKTWIGSQIKYDANILANSGFELGGALLDTLVMDRLIDPGRPHGLKEAYEREFGERMMTFGETFYPKGPSGKPRKPPKKEMHQILLEAYERDPTAVIDYASLDAWSVYRLYERLREQLEQITTWYGYSLFDVFTRFEMPFTRVLYAMERRGVLLDVDYLTTIEPLIVARMKEVGSELNQLAGFLVNPNSPPQLQKLFFERLRLDPVEKTKSGAPSTAKSVLKHFAAEGVDAARLVLEYRGLSKLLGTYVHGLIGRADDFDRVHTTLNQHTADTGRLSSSNPNLQNQTRAGSALFDIRKAFVPTPGYTMLVLDYDQLEMYITGHFSGAPGLVQAAWDGKDIHTANVELVYGEPYDEVMAAKKAKERTEHQEYLAELRQAVKSVGFGLIYGKAARSLGVQLGYEAGFRTQYPHLADRAISKMSTDRAQEVIDDFFSGLPEVQDFIHNTQRTVADTKYTETVLGRRRWFWDIMDWDDQVAHRLAAEKKHRRLCWCAQCKLSRDGDRAAVNHRIQGTAADITMLAMIKCHQDERLRELGVHMLLQVHDEVVFEVPDAHIEEASKIIQYHMEHPGLDLKVPLRAPPGTGQNWQEAK